MEQSALPVTYKEPAKGFRILVVDDVQDIAESIALLLEMWGYSVQFRMDPFEALAFSHEFAPDVVILDIGLPGMNGYVLARHLRESAATRHALLIALSGYSRDENPATNSTSDFDHFLTKPADFNRLQALIGDHLRSLRTSAE